MKLRIKTYNKGYTLIELMVTLTIFSIIAMFGVPAFYNFIEKSRAKSQIIHAANFLRSAQEIASATNRVIYVYTDGYLNYTNHKDDYWYQDWVMSFKPIGQLKIENNNSSVNTISDQDAELGVNSNEPNKGVNYLITRQRIFTPSDAYQLFIIDSTQHNSNDFASLEKNSLGSSDALEMDGYSIVRNSKIQGAEEGKPTFLTFHPSGAVTMPIFIIAESGENQSFDATHISGRTANHWVTMRAEFTDTIAVLAGCRVARGLNIDSINYTFNSALINSDTLFDTPILKNYDHNYFAAPSFEDKLCGSRFLQ